MVYTEQLPSRLQPMDALGIFAWHYFCYKNTSKRFLQYCYHYKQPFVCKLYRTRSQSIIYNLYFQAFMPTLYKDVSEQGEVINLGKQEPFTLVLGFNVDVLERHLLLEAEDKLTPLKRALLVRCNFKATINGRVSPFCHLLNMHEDCQHLQHHCCHH